MPKHSAEAREIDRHVSHAIKSHRRARGMTQGELYHEVGVTYQQGHKYEQGINRVTCGRLYTIAKALGVQVTDLFPEQHMTVDTSPRAALLLAAYERMSPEARRLIYDIVRRCAQLEENS